VTVDVLSSVSALCVSPVTALLGRLISSQMKRALLQLEWRGGKGNKLSKGNTHTLASLYVPGGGKLPAVAIHLVVARLGTPSASSRLIGHPEGRAQCHAGARRNGLPQKRSIGLLSSETDKVHKVPDATHGILNGRGEFLHSVHDGKVAQRGVGVAPACSYSSIVVGGNVERSAVARAGDGAQKPVGWAKERRGGGCRGCGRRGCRGCGRRGCCGCGRWWLAWWSVWWSVS
jgi:hypothetical protein